MSDTDSYSSTVAWAKTETQWTVSQQQCPERQVVFIDFLQAESISFPDIIQWYLISNKKLHNEPCLEEGLRNVDVSIPKLIWICKV